MKYFYLGCIAMFFSLVSRAGQGSEGVAIQLNASEQPSIWGNPWVLLGVFVFAYLFFAVTGGRGLNSPKP